MKFHQFYFELFHQFYFTLFSSLHKHYNSFKSTGVIASIFEDHWESTYLDNKDLIDKYRPNAVIEVQKIIDCYNKDLGCSIYNCIYYP